MDEIASLTRRLAAIPSHEDESRAGDAIERWLRTETDASVTRDAVGNVLAVRGNGAVSIGLVGHHDVVAPDPKQLSGDGYRVTTRNGRIYGRGTADMKGAVAAAMLAFRDADPEQELVFASFVGEEVGGTGVRHAIDTGFDVDYAIVGEGSTNYSMDGVTDVVVAHRGRRELEFEATGTSAHAGEPDAGENAIYRACSAVDRIRAVDAPATTVFDLPIRGSCAVTRIDGGATRNVIPDTCSLVVDERTVPGDRIDYAPVESIPGMTGTIVQDLPPMKCVDRAFASRLRAAAASIQSGQPELVTKPHATDAGWLAEAGTVCVVCGPAEPGEAHTATESVSIPVLERCYRIYRAGTELTFDWVT